jgi:hypothetical protein
LPKSLHELRPEEQRELFGAEIRKRITTGELDPGLADEAMAYLVGRLDGRPPMFGQA